MASAAETFLLEIQQRMSGDAMTPLKALENEVSAAKAKFTELAKASDAANKAVDKNSAALAAASQRYKDAIASGDTSAAAKAAADFKKLTSAQGELEDKAKAAAEAMQAQGKAVDGLAHKFVALKKSEDDAAKVNQKHKFDIGKFGDGLEKMGGPLGFVGGGIKKLAESYKGLREAGLSSAGSIASMAAAGLTTLATAAVAATVAVAGLGIAMLDSHRDMKLTLEAMFQSQTAADAMAESFGNITDETGVASDRLLQLTRDLKKANVAADDIPSALRALAQQEKALGDQSGTSQLIEDLKSGKQSVAGLASAMETQFGTIAAKKAMGLGSLVDRLKNKVLGLIDNIDIEPLLARLEKVYYFAERLFLGIAIGILDVAIEAKKLAKAFGFDFGDLEKFPDMAGMAKVAGMALGAVLVVAAAAAISLNMAARKVIQFFNDAPGSIEKLKAKFNEFVESNSTASAAMNALKSVGTAVMAVFQLGQSVVSGFLAVIGAVGTAVAAAAEKLGLISAAGTVFGVVMSAIGIFIGLAKAQIDSALASIDALAKGVAGAADVGKAVVDGIAKGISDNASAVMDALTGVVNDAIDGAKKLLGIQSPSKVFAGIGENVTAGFSQGIEDTAPAAEKAMAGLVAPPKVATGETTGTMGNTISVTININGAGASAKEIAEQVEDQLTDFFDRMALQVAA